MALDPSSYTPAQVEAELLRYIGLLESATQQCRKRGIACAEADSVFRTAYALAVVGAEGTVLERESHAAIATQVEYRAKREAEELLHAARSASSNLREMVGALRTIATNLRQLMDVAR